MDRLYVVVRSDLPPGSQLAQSCHACGAYAATHTDDYLAWVRGESNIVCLSASSKDELEGLLAQAEARGIKSAAFREPDYAGELTAIALEEGARKIVSNLPLALKKR